MTTKNKLSKPITGNYLQVPDILLRNGCKPIDALVWAIILSYQQGKTGYCFASEIVLGKKLGVSKNTIGNSINHLLELGFVKDLNEKKANAGISKHLVVNLDKVNNLSEPNFDRGEPNFDLSEPNFERSEPNFENDSCSSEPKIGTEDSSTSIGHKKDSSFSFLNEENQNLDPNHYREQIQHYFINDIGEAVVENLGKKFSNDKWVELFDYVYQKTIAETNKSNFEILESFSRYMVLLADRENNKIALNSIEKLKEEFDYSIKRNKPDPNFCPEYPDVIDEKEYAPFPSNIGTKRDLY